MTTGAGTATSTQAFTPKLSITGFSPLAGPAGTAVTINGAGFNGSSTVTFNGTAATSVTDVSAAKLRVNDGAVVTFTVQVTNNGPDDAENVVVDDSYTHGELTGISAAAPSGASCAGATCTTASLEPGQAMTY